MAEHLKHLPKPLLEDILQNQCIPIIGAGFSLNAELPKGKQMPLWEDLGKLISEEMIDYPYSNPIDALSAYCHEFSKSKLVEKLGDLLHIIDSKPGAVHTAFSRVPFDIACTTNFDFLLEKSYEQVGKYCRPVIEEEQLSITTKQYSSGNTEPSITLIKLHGDLHHPNRVVATEKDYDSFLDNYPLISTYLANLLITRTPLFIGYSLDDPDFRQVWQIIKNRLGNLCRPAYALVVNANSHVLAKFNRRGVKVINIPGRSYKQVLEHLFDELRNYWVENLPRKGSILNDQALAEISLPTDARSRLCYFGVSNYLKSFYKTYIYPVVAEYGFTPVSYDDLITAGDNIAAKVTALVSRAELIIVDVENEQQLAEVKIALVNRKNRPLVLFIGPAKRKVPFISLDESNFSYVVRDEEPYSQPDSLIQSIEEWLQKSADGLRNILFDEPKRLLDKREYNAAIISAITLLENNLRKKIEESGLLEKQRFRHISLGKLIKFAVQEQIISSEMAGYIGDWIHWRNQVVHSHFSSTAKDAKQIVYGVLEVVMGFEQAAGAKL